jgi:UDP-N-acetylmuramoyl-L-alanyl-D-glutamate--2,6-diaminopimelate ligase
MLRDCRATIVRCTATGRPGADASVRAGPMTFAGMPLTLAGPWGTIEGHVRLIGAFNAINMLQAAAAAHAAGLDRDSIALSLYRLRPPPGRLEMVTRGVDPEPFAVFVDYAHTDDALAKALAAVRPLLAHTGGRLRVVFGCGGDKDRTKRPRMARVARDLADDLFITSDNPRTEDPRAIIEMVLAGLPTAEARAAAHVDPDRRASIHAAIASAREGDVVLIAGKGHEDYQLISDGGGGIRRIEFDDRLVARAALHERFGGAAPRAAEPARRAQEAAR